MLLTSLLPLRGVTQQFSGFSAFHIPIPISISRERTLQYGGSVISFSLCQTLPFSVPLSDRLTASSTLPGPSLPLGGSSVHDSHPTVSGVPAGRPCPGKFSLCGVRGPFALLSAGKVEPLHSTPTAPPPPCQPCSASCLLQREAGAAGSVASPVVLSEPGSVRGYHPISPDRPRALPSVNCLPWSSLKVPCPGMSSD